MGVEPTFPVLEETPIQQKRRPLPRWFKVGCWSCVVCFAVVGAFVSSQTMARIRWLDAEIARIRPLAAPLTIDDPDRVHIVSVPHDNDVSGQWEWRFRLYFPSGYDVRHSFVQGLITADGAEYAYSKEVSNWAMLGAGSSTTLANPKAIEGLGGISFFEDEHSTRNWIQLIQHGSGQASFGKQKGYCIDDIDDPCIDVAGAAETVSFDQDKPICLLRVREREPRATDSTTGKPLYLGLFVYLIPNSDKELPMRLTPESSFQ